MDEIVKMGSTEDGLRQLNLLAALKEITGENGHSTGDDVMKHAGYSGGHRAFAQDVEALKAKGWIVHDVDIETLWITQDGRELAEDFLQLRGSAIDRQLHAADAALRWLASLAEDDQRADNWHDLKQIPDAQFLGVGLDDEDLKRIWTLLHLKKFIDERRNIYDGTTTEVGITPQGIEFLEGGGSIASAPSDHGGR